MAQPSVGGHHPTQSLSRDPQVSRRDPCPLPPCPLSASWTPPQPLPWPWSCLQQPWPPLSLLQQVVVVMLTCVKGSHCACCLLANAPRSAPAGELFVVLTFSGPHYARPAKADQKLQPPTVRPQACAHSLHRSSWNGSCSSRICLSTLSDGV